MNITIRTASYQDVTTLTVLSEQLGHPVDAHTLHDRLTLLLGSPDLHQVWVAEVDGDTAGWLHGFWRPLLDSPSAVEIGGLIVGLHWRRQGVGQQLLQACEQWARSKGATLVTLRAVMHQKDAYQFFEEQGYQLVEGQHTYRKAL